jgi:large subunit ribosomal protein L15
MGAPPSTDRSIPMDLSTLKPNDRKIRNRVGRGHGSGNGKTSGRGQKGFKARYSVARGFEGGQNKLYMRLPMMRGLSNKSHNIGIFRKEIAIINVGQLVRFEEGTEVTPELLMSQGLVKKLGDGLKVLGEGSLDKALTVKAHAFSASAREKLEKAGGVAEVIAR